MSHLIEVNTGVTGYRSLLEHVLIHGRPRVSRGLETLDAGWTTVRVHRGDAYLPLGVGRGVSRAIAAAEALQLVGAFSAPELLPPSFDRFKEEDGRFWGAYGDRVRSQVSWQLAKIQDDPGTRQAVVNLWQSPTDNVPGKRDYPCTLVLVFELRDEHLNLYVTMRSQDVWLGTPYDWFQFGQLLHSAANSLGVSVGDYYHTTVSTHLYTRNVEDAKRCVNAVTDQGVAREWQPRGLGLLGQDFPLIMQRAAMLHAHVTHKFPLPSDITRSEEWYRENLRQFTPPTS